jgi:hypothetical protein
VPVDLDVVVCNRCTREVLAEPPAQTRHEGVRLS